MLGKVYLLHGPIIDQRPLRHASVQTVSEYQLLLHRLLQLVHELVENCVLHEDTISANASLTTGAELRRYCSLNSTIEVGRFEDDEGRVTAQFQADAFDFVGRLLE